MRTIFLRSLGIRASSAIFYLEEGKLKEDPPLVLVLVIKEKYFLLGLQLSSPEHETSKIEPKSVQAVFAEHTQFKTKNRKNKNKQTDVLNLRTPKSASIHLLKKAA